MVRQDPLSGVKNTDPNPVTTGKYGPQFSKHPSWHRGTPEAPDSRFERLTVLTWQHGGFADTAGGGLSGVFCMRRTPGTTTVLQQQKGTLTNVKGTVRHQQ